MMALDNQDENNEELLVLIDTLLKFKNREHMFDFLFGILTPKELVEVPKRLAIVTMLKNGVAHQEIAKKLGVGIATVTRGSTELKKGRFKYV